VSQASSAAQAKLVAAWPEGKAGLPDERHRVGIDERRPLTADGVAQDE
jgi:hypothetical protein